MIVLALASLLSVTASQDTIRMTLDDALERARRTNPGFIRETLNSDNDYLSWLGARADRYLPEVGVRLTTPEYISALRRVSGPDGSDRFVPTLRRTVEGEIEITQPLPTGGTFSISGTLTSLNQPNEDADERFSGATFLGFQISQDFFGINNRHRGYRLAREDYVRSQTQFLEEERELATDVITEYYDLVQAIKEAQIDSLLFVRDSIRSAGARPANTAGMTDADRLVDSLRFRLASLRSASSRTQSRQELERQRASFNEMFGLPLNTIIVPDTVVRFERTVVNAQEGLAYARANRLDLKLAELSVDNRRAGLRDARKTSPITVELESTIGFDGSSETFSMRSALRDALAAQERSTSIQLSVSIPLFDRFEERYEVAEARNDLRSAELSLEEQLRELESEVHLAAQNVMNAITQAELAETQYQITSQTLRIQTDRFARGEVQSAEFLIDQADAREAEVELLEAQVEVLLANEEWKRVIGEPPFRTASPPPSPPGSMRRFSPASLLRSVKPRR
jgi:outer membrane protein TolC